MDRSLLEASGAWTDLAATLHNLGHVALEQDAHERALSYFEQSRDLYAAFDLDEYRRGRGRDDPVYSGAAGTKVQFGQPRLISLLTRQTKL